MLNEKFSEIEFLDLHDLTPVVPASRLDQERIARYKTQDMSKMPPIEYLIDPETGLKIITDGNHRWETCRQISMQKVPAMPTRLPEQYHANFLRLFAERRAATTV